MISHNLDDVLHMFDAWLDVLWLKLRAQVVIAQPDLTL